MGDYLLSGMTFYSYRTPFLSVSPITVKVLRLWTRAATLSGSRLLLFVNLNIIEYNRCTASQRLYNITLLNQPMKIGVEHGIYFLSTNENQCFIMNKEYHNLFVTFCSRLLHY